MLKWMDARNLLLRCVSENVVVEIGERAAWNLVLIDYCYLLQAESRLPITF